MDTEPLKGVTWPCVVHGFIGHHYTNMWWDCVGVIYGLHWMHAVSPVNDVHICKWCYECVCRPTWCDSAAASMSVAWFRSRQPASIAGHLLIQPCILSIIPTDGDEVQLQAWHGALGPIHTVQPPPRMLIIYSINCLVMIASCAALVCFFSLYQISCNFCCMGTWCYILKSVQQPLPEAELVDRNLVMEQQQPKLVKHHGLVWNLIGRMCTVSLYR